MVDTAVMHVMEGTADTSQLRISAMHEVNPLHMFMFNSRGSTLNMNNAALEACQYSGQPYFVSLSHPTSSTASLVLHSCTLYTVLKLMHIPTLSCHGRSVTADPFDSWQITLEQ